jgi:phosphohistidine phosphatase
MKTLILVRHAKSSWEDRGLPDHERPLNARGQRDAPIMGERLADRGLEVDRIVSSSAIRALTTAEIIAEALGLSAHDIVVDDRLYLADPQTLLEVVDELEEYLDCVMMFGHNPGMTDLANMLAPRHFDYVPTCGVVELRYEIDAWADVGEVDPAGVSFDYPKKAH